MESAGVEDILVTAFSMIINFVTEFLFQKFVVYRHQENTNNLALNEDEKAFNLILKVAKSENLDKKFVRF